MSSFLTRTDAVIVETKRHGGEGVELPQFNKTFNKNMSFQHRSIRLNNDDINI